MDTDLFESCQSTGLFSIATLIRSDILLNSLTIKKKKGQLLFYFTSVTVLVLIKINRV